MRKKIIFGSILLLVLVLIGLFLFSNRKEIVEPKEGGMVAMQLTKEQVATIQEKFHNQGYGYIDNIYPLDEKRSLFFVKERTIDYDPEFPGDQLIWVETDGEEFKFTALSTGNYPLHLVLKDKRPYFTQDGTFYLIFYEGEGTDNTIQNRKGYVYEIHSKGIEKVYETTGNYYNFAMNKQNRMVVIEKVEAENRNLFPSFLAPYELYYQQYDGKEWTMINKKYIEPDLQKEYEQYEEKKNKK